MITVSREKFDEIEERTAYLGEAVSALEMLARSLSHTEDPRPTDALFCLARSIRVEVDAVLDWHGEILKAQSK